MPKHTRVHEHKALTWIDPAAGRGLEIGALGTPIVPRNAFDVETVDVHSTAELRRRYATDPKGGRAPVGLH